MTQIFISHSKSDRTFVERELFSFMKPLRKHLRIEPWFAKTDIRTSDDWENSIQSGLESSDWFMLVMSTNSKASEWVKKELDWAMEHLQGRIIPVRIDDSPAEDFHDELSRIQDIDFSQNEEDARAKLIEHFCDVVAMPPRRADAVTGGWHGDVWTHGDDNNEPTAYHVEAFFSTNRHRITGSFSTDVSHGDSSVHAEYTVDGEFFDARFFQLNYVSNNTATIQFGSIVLELNPRGTEAKGKFTGFGPRREGILTGDVLIKKQKPA